MKFEYTSANEETVWAFGRDTTWEEAEADAMKRHDEQYPGEPTFFQPVVSPIELVNYMNHMGSQGWEMIHMSKSTLYFKRVIND
jgi:hypothetical protein